VEELVETFDPKTGLLVSRGWEVDGIKVGMWFHYSADSGIVTAKGNYVKGKKHGVWLEFSTIKGSLVSYTVVYFRGVRIIKIVKVRYGTQH
jgi:antitoxin component YwqK of YwqJK toxin-antitoxin module